VAFWKNAHGRVRARGPGDSLEKRAWSCAGAGRR